MSIVCARNDICTSFMREHCQKKKQSDKERAKNIKIVRFVLCNIRGNVEKETIKYSARNQLTTIERDNIKGISSGNGSLS